MGNKYGNILSLVRYVCILHALLPSLLTLSLSHLFDMYSTLTSMQATSGSIHQLSYRLYTYTFTSPLFLLFFFMVRVYLDWMNMCVCVCVCVCVCACVCVSVSVFQRGWQVEISFCRHRHRQSADTVISSNSQ